MAKKAFTKNEVEKLKNILVHDPAQEEKADTDESKSDHREKIFQKLTFYENLFTLIVANFTTRNPKSRIERPGQINELKDLRLFSPARYNPSVFLKNNFPATTIISAENDYFKKDADDFYEVLHSAGCHAIRKTIPKSDHTCMWQSQEPARIAKRLYDEEVAPRL
ncbi:MAG: hypothetical protein ACE365_03710 [Gammaproteobacteria bacterium]